jgi:hypothetical protein
MFIKCVYKKQMEAPLKKLQEKKSLIAYYVQTTMLLQDLTVTGPPVIVVTSSCIRFRAVEVVELVEAAELM